MFAYISHQIKSNQIKFICSNISHLHVGISKISLWAGPTRL